MPTEYMGVGRTLNFDTNPVPVIVAARTIPRIGFLSHETCLQAAMRQLPEIKAWINTSGAFWDKGMQRVIRTAREFEDPRDGRPCEYILTLDYDTLFTADQVIHMVNMLEANKDWDCIIPVQANRHKEEPMMINPTLDYSGQYMLHNRGHFGCTLFRASMFGDSLHRKPRTVPLPWFHNQPNKRGYFDEPGALDPDIYFWVSAEQSGCKVVQWNSTCLGHVQEMYMWQDGMQTVIQNPKLYARQGAPDLRSLSDDADAIRSYRQRKMEEANLTETPDGATVQDP